LVAFTLSGQLGGVAVNPIGEKITQGLGFPLREVDEVAINSYTLQVTDDAGVGTVEADLNATDFTGQGTPASPNTYMSILASDVVNITHKAVLYGYTGPKKVTVGVGGSYVTTAADFIAQGTADHNLLVNLGAADQHPIASITGLPAQQAAQDQTFTDHITPATVPDPHDQYARESEILANFTASGYGGIGASAATGIANLTGAWATLTVFDTAEITVPRNVVQNTIAGALAISLAGTWVAAIALTLTHNEQNSGRVLGARLFNQTTGTAGRTTSFAVGRNQPGTNINVSILLEIAAINEGDLYVVQLSGLSDTFSSVIVETAQFSTYSVGLFPNSI